MNELKKTNITAIFGYGLLFLWVIQNNGLFPTDWKPWIDAIIEYGSYTGFAGLTAGLSHKAIKGEPIIKGK